MLRGVTLVMVAIGGAAGAVTRYLVDGWVLDRTGAGFPWGTLAINVSGSFVIGILAALTIDRAVLPADIRGPVMIGFVGAYTTFSTLSLESYRLLEDGAVGLALANTLGTPPAPSRRKAIDATLRGFPLALRLVDARPRLVLSAEGARGGLAALVAVLAEAQAAGTWERLKACREETCGWVFYDGSRNRSSSWCSMQVCGGRAKASSYRRRRSTRQSRRSRR